MADKKLFPEKRLRLEKDSGSVTRYVKMLEFNNKLLLDRLRQAVESLEEREDHVPDDNVDWRDELLEE